MEKQQKANQADSSSSKAKSITEIIPTKIILKEFTGNVNITKLKDANQEPDENKKSGSSGQDGPREEPNEFKDQRPIIIVEPNLDLGVFASGTESESGAEDTYMADDAPSQSP